MERSIGMILGESYMLLTEGTHENDDQDDIFWHGIVNNIRVRQKVTRNVEQEDQKHRECSKKAKIDETI